MSSCFRWVSMHTCLIVISIIFITSVPFNHAKREQIISRNTVLNSLAIETFFLLYESVEVDTPKRITVDPYELLNLLSNRAHFNNIKNMVWQKRGPGSEFLGKRKRSGDSPVLNRRGLMGSEFLGKRIAGSEFLGKRVPGSEFLGKRVPGSEFLGKRVPGSEFLGKRLAGSEFLGKRVPGSEFLGKRATDDKALYHDYYDREMAEPPILVKRSPELPIPSIQSDRNSIVDSPQVSS